MSHQRKPLPAPSITHHTHGLDPNGVRICKPGACDPTCKRGTPWPTLRMDSRDDPLEASN